MVRQIDYWFMHQVQANIKINMIALIFQDLIKIVRGSIKTISYGMHLSHIIERAGCDVTIDPPLLQSKYTYFDKHTLGCMHYVMDIHNNYVKKPKGLQSSLSRECMMCQNNSPRKCQLHQRPAHGPPALPLLALPDSQFVILDKLIHLRQMMMSHFDQMNWRIEDLKSTKDAIRVIVDALQATQSPPPSSQTLSRIFFKHEAMSSC